MKLTYSPTADTPHYTINILVDTPASWIMPWAQDIIQSLTPYHQVNLATQGRHLIQGDMAFLLGCTKLLAAADLKKNKLNLVVHESDLPQGRGWSPVAWQVLEGKNRIPVVLFEARADVDSGPIYLKDYIDLEGTELLAEIRNKQGQKTADLVFDFLAQWPDLEPSAQTGEASFYRKRGLTDDQLDLDKTLREHFNHLRIVDNQNYPAWFEIDGHRYEIHIFHKQ